MRYPVRTLLIVMAIGPSVDMLCSQQARADDGTGALRWANIKFTRGDDGAIFAVELPPRAKDVHIKAVVGTPALVASIREIKAPECGASFERFKELEKLLNLSAIYLEGVSSANDYVAYLRGCRNLRTVSLAGSDLTNHGLNDLCLDHPALHELDVSRTSVTDIGLAALDKLSGLESLRAVVVRSEPAEGDDTASERGVVARLAALPSLKHLEFFGLALGDGDLDALSKSTTLEALVFDNFDLHGTTDKLISLQNANPKLRLVRNITQRLAVRCLFAQDGTIRLIRGCEYDRFVRIPRCLLVHLDYLSVRNAASLEFIEWLPELTTLRIDNCSASSKEFDRLSKAGKIQSLSLSHIKVDGLLFEILASISSAQQITLSSCDISDDVMTKIRQNASNGRINVN